MDDKLILCVGRFETHVFGKVLNMPERLRGKGTLRDCDHNSVIKRIASETEPELNEDTLYICGDVEDLDGQMFSHTFSTEREACDAVINIRGLVAAINDKVVKDEAQQFAIEILE